MMNYYGGPGADKSGLYPGASYPGASFGVPQQPGMAPGHSQPTTIQSFPSGASSQPYSAFPGMAPGQSMYTTTGYSIPHGYPSAVNGSAGLAGMGAFYSTPHGSTLPYSTLQPIPQATPSIPSIASLPSVPAVPHIPSIQPTQSGYPASHAQYQLSQAYLSDPLATTQPSYAVGANHMMPGGMSSSSLQGVPRGYQTGSAVPPMGYPNHAMTNPYAGMPGVRVSPHAGPPYGQRFG